MLSFIEFLNETKQSNSLTKADEFFNMLCESEQLDEGFKDTLKSWWNKAKNILSKPINAINKVLDKDKELIKKTEENLRTMKKSELASIYGMEFANSNIIDDLIDFISMLKDIALFRYKKLPWRTAISAVALLGYILFPKNIKAGTILFTAVNKGFVDPMNDGIDFINKYIIRKPVAEGFVPGLGQVGGDIADKYYDDLGKVSKHIIDQREPISNIDQLDTSSISAKILDSIDEITIIYLLWKWFRADLVDYRKWLVAKDIAKNEVPTNI